MIAKIEIPPGVSNNGTVYENAGRWWSADGFRWFDGAMAPLAGRHVFASPQTPTALPIRGMLPWRDNDGNRFIAMASPTKLEVIGDQLVHPSDVEDITPAGFTTGNEDGSGDTMADTWSLDTWGQYLVACATSDGKLYEWQLDYSTPTVAQEISGAPTGCTGLIVTGERFVFALGAGGDPRKVQWCDQGDNTDWTPTATNQAGSFLLETDGRILTAVRARGETLIFTDSGDIWAARFVGQPFVYAFERVGSGAAPCGPNAVVSVDDGVFWMGRGSFYMYDGRVRPIPCDVRDVTFHLDNPVINTYTNEVRLDDEQRHKVHAFTMQKYSELWWMYPTDATETEFRYVSLNYKEGFWMMGATDDPIAVDRGVYPYPISVNNGGTRWYLDSPIGTGNSWWNIPFAQSGPLQVTDGQRWFAARRFIFDHINASTLANVLLQTWDSQVSNPVLAQNLTGALGSDSSVGVRFTGRMLGIYVTAVNNRLRFGTPLIDFVERGKR